MRRIKIEVHNRNRAEIERDIESFGGRPSARSSKTPRARLAGSSTRADQRQCRCVGKCPTGLFIRAEERRFRVTASLSACRANDDSITQTSLGRSIAIIRRKSEERLAAGARKRMQIHTHAYARARRGYAHARRNPSTSFFKRVSLSLSL